MNIYKVARLNNPNTSLAQSVPQSLKKWFDDFDRHLKFLFEDESTHLVFYRQNYKFKISLKNREFDFQTLSSGYLAIFEILAKNRNPNKSRYN